MINTSKITVNSNSGCDYSGASMGWDDIISTLSWDSKIKANLDDEELRKRIAAKINEVLDEDTTIEIMKKYLLGFIDKNIENPENLIKDVLVKRDEELNKYKDELDKCREEIDQLRVEICNLKAYLPVINPIMPNPGIFPDPYLPLTTTPNITWTSGSGYSSATC